jgi:Rieske 2Fe-2S family protein
MRLKLKPSCRKFAGETAIPALATGPPSMNISTLLMSQRSGRGLDRPFYTDPAVYQADLEQLWYREWIYAASAAEFAKAGAYVTIQLGTYPVVIVRGADGQIRAFHNVCRHRGQRLCAKPSGQTVKLVCPYHQWTYETDGRLLWARDMGPDFDASKHGLKQLHCDIAAGMVFVCLAETAPDFAAVKAAADRYTAGHSIADLKVAHQSRVLENGNWKLVLENNRECYHCAGAHPSLCRTFDDNPDLVGADDSLSSPAGAAHVNRCEDAGLPSRYLISDNEQWRFVRIPFVGDALSYTMDGKAAAPKLPDMPFANAGSLLFFHYPNTWNHFLSDHVLNFRVLPISPTETEVTTTWLVHKDAVEGRDYDLTRLTEVWEATNDEDRRVVEENQFGINSPAYEPGPYSVRQESGVIQFVDWYVKSMIQKLGPQSVAAE